MPAGLLLPVLALAGVLACSVALLRMDMGRQRLQVRVQALATPGRVPDPVSGQRQNIRVSQRRSIHLIGLMGRALGKLTDMKRAQIIPTWLMVIIGSMAAIAATVVGRLYFSLPLSVLGGVVTVLLVVRFLFRWQSTRFTAKLRRQLPDAIELLVSVTSAGLPVSEGFRTIAREMPEPTADEFRRIIAEIALGAPVDEALRTLHRRTRVPEYAILAVTLAVQARSGGRLAETISTLADTVRQRMGIVARARALAGEAKLSAIILAILPIVGAGAMSLTQPGFLVPLFNDPRGQRLLFIAIVTLTLGIITMRQLIRGATRD